MGFAAVPAYLGRDFSQASPGLRFGMYLELWGKNSRTGELLWTTHDINYRIAGTQRQEREYKDENKTGALKQTLKLTTSDKTTMAALAGRQAALAALDTTGQLLRLEARSIAPFAMGLGNEHPLENGFAFLNPYGLPYLPGSGVKGVLRQAARELANGDWGDTQGWNEAAITVLFGKESGDRDTDHQRGALMFWDVFPLLKGDALQVEVMTPHQSHYYQKGETPHESGQPNPINFLSVPPESGFTFHIQCNRPFLTRIAPDLTVDDRWKDLVKAAIEHAFQWLGFGAKTAVGYGAFARDAEAEKRHEVEQQAQKKAVEDEARERKRLAALDPMAQRMEALIKENPNQPEVTVLINALKAGEWTGEDGREAALRIKKRMQEQRSWRDKSAKKKPEKDKAYQQSLAVKHYLDGGP